MSEESYNQPEYERWSPRDILEGGYVRSELDHSIFTLNKDFYDAFGYSEGPLVHACALIGEQRPVTILDAGCGTGRTLYDIVDLTCRSEGCPPSRIRPFAVNDINFSGQSMYQEVRRVYREGIIPYVMADIRSLPFSDETFDLVYSYDVFPYNNEPQELLQELVRVLKPGGALYFDVDGFWQDNFEPFHHTVSELSRDNLNNTVEKRSNISRPGKASKVVYKVTKPSKKRPPEKLTLTERYE